MPRIFIDMDGVVADFDTEARRLMNLTDEELAEAEASGRYPDAKWAAILGYQRFYRFLPKMPRADAMINIGRSFRDHLGYELRMLTAIPKDNDFPEAFNDKIQWMKEHYPDITVWFGPYSEDKQHHCKSADDILIDDRLSNIEQWRAAGGRAVHVTADYDQALTDCMTEYYRIINPSTINTEPPQWPQPQALSPEALNDTLDIILSATDPQ